MPSPRRGEPSAPPTFNLRFMRLALLLLPLVLLIAPREAHAYQWMLMHGYPSCGACHTDPSGGELLTPYGRMQSEGALSMVWGSSSGSALDDLATTRPRLVRKDPELLAARAKLAGKDEATEAEAEAEAEEGADANADAATTEEGSADAAPTEAAPAAEESKGYDDGLGAITPFLFRLWAPPDWLTLGGSYRHLNIITPGGEEKFKTFPMMLDVYGQVQFGNFRAGGSIGGARVAAGSPYARSAQITTNQGKDWNLISRTHYVGYYVTDALDLRVGRLNLPFGVRVPEHTLWVRQQTRTDRESGQQHGVNLHYAGESFRAEVMAIAGNYQINPDEFRERGYAGYFEYFLTAKTVVGVNSLVTAAKNDRVSPKITAPGSTADSSMTRHAHGAMLRAAVGDSTVWVMEIDALMRTGFEPGYVGFTQVDFQAMQGLHFMLTGEILDSGHSKAADASPRAAGAGKPRLGGWLSASWWPVPHFDVRIDAIQRQGEDFSILGQLHLYL
jgi:hypothetical protein